MVPTNVSSMDSFEASEAMKAMLEIVSSTYVAIAVGVMDSDAKARMIEGLLAAMSEPAGFLNRHNCAY